MGRRLLPALLAALVGCGSLETSEVERWVQERRRAVVRLVDQGGAPRGLGAVVRATREQVVLAAPDDRDLPWLQLGDERIALERLGPGLLACPRRWDLHALLPAPDLAPGSPVVLLSSRAGPWVDGWTSQTVGGPGPTVVLGPVQAIATHPDRDRQEPGPDELRGALVFTTTGELVGLVEEVRGEQLAVRGVEPLRAEVLSRTAGAEEVLAPGDAARLLRLSIGGVQGVPTASDEWGEPDFLLLFEVAGARLPPIPLLAPPGTRWTARVPDRGPVRVRLVERDVTIADGVVDQEVGRPIELPWLELEQGLAFAPHPAFLTLEPGSWPPGRRLELRLRVEELDPDSVSGPDRTPFGAGVTALRRVTSGTVDLEGGDANDLWLFDLEQRQELVCAFLRRDTRAAIALEGWTGPGLGAVLRVAPGPERRLGIARGTFDAGRSLLRVRMQAGPSGPSPWELLVAPAADPDGLVRALFRLLSRESSGQAAWLGTGEFAQEVAAALSFEAGLPAETAARAILGELGHRIAPIRHLVLRLLELHFPPPEAALEAILAGGSGPDEEGEARVARARVIDAGLLLALRRGAGPRDADVLRRAAADPDPLIRLRALVAVSRIEDPGLRVVMRELFRNDPSPLVQRAYERSE